MRYHVYQFLDKTDNFEFLGPNLPKNGFWGQNFKNLSLDSESASLRYYVYQFSNIMDNFNFLDPNFPKNEFWGRNFKNLSLDSESTSLRSCVHQCSDKMDNFYFFGLNLGKLPNYVQYFGPNIAEGVRWRLKWAGRRWMELGGGWCRV